MNQAANNGDEDDNEGSLPTPMSEDQNEDLIGEISSSEEDESENEQSNGGEERGLDLPISEKTFLSHGQAMNELLLKEGPSNFLSGWTDGDITGLLVQLTKHSHEERGVRLIAKNFRETTLVEILECIDECKKINRRASEGRLCFQRVQEEEQAGNSSKDMSEQPNYTTWPSLFTSLKKSRAIGDNSADVIGKFLRDRAEDCHEENQDLPDFSRIYCHLSSLAQGYAVKRLRALDAAVILDIFEQMETDVDSLPSLKHFFKRLFHDMQLLPGEEFKLDDSIKVENAGGGMMNPLDFPVDNGQQVFQHFEHK